MHAPSSKRRLRSMLSWLHLWGGLSIGVLFALVALAGSVLVFHTELLCWQHPQLTQHQPRADGRVLATLIERWQPQGLRSLDLPRDEWMCLELELLVSETGGRAVLRADGATVVDRSGIDTRPAGAIGHLAGGISYAGAAGAGALVDDVVVASEPLASCP